MVEGPEPPVNAPSLEELIRGSPKAEGISPKGRRNFPQRGRGLDEVA